MLNSLDSFGPELATAGHNWQAKKKREKQQNIGWQKMLTHCIWCSSCCCCCVDSNANIARLAAKVFRTAKLFFSYIFFFRLGLGELPANFKTQISLGNFTVYCRCCFVRQTEKRKRNRNRSQIPNPTFNRCSFFKSSEVWTSGMANRGTARRTVNKFATPNEMSIKSSYTA